MYVNRVKINIRPHMSDPGRDKSHDQRNINFPNKLARAIYRAGYTHVDVHVIPDGILLKPVVMEDGPGRLTTEIDLPNWK